MRAPRETKEVTMFCIQVKHGNHYKTVSHTYNGRAEAEQFREMYLKQFPQAEPAKVLTVIVDEPQKVAGDIAPCKTSLRKPTMEQAAIVDHAFAGFPWGD